MKPLPILVVALCLAGAARSNGLVLAQDQEPPAVAGVHERSNQEPPAVSDEQIEETLAMVRDALKLCREAEVDADLEEARLHARGALELMQTLGGLRDPKLVTSLEAIASRAGGLGLLPAQLAAREWIVGIREDTLPADHPDLLMAKQRLALTRHDLRDLEGARVLEEQVHEARERLLPADHPDLLMAKNNLANTLHALGDLETARALREHVHAAWERMLPADDRKLLIAKSNLALTRYSLGDLEGSQELLEQAHAGWERLVPADHPDLLTAKQGLASTRKALGDLDGARELEEHVHAARERLLPTDHPDLLSIKHNLAITRSALGDLEGARELEEHVHAVRERLLPADHPDLLLIKNNLATTRYTLGDLEGANEVLEYVHAACERLLPADHPFLLATKQNLGITRGDLGDLEGASELFEQAHAIRDRLLPPDHPDLLSAKNNLAIARYILGDLEGALAMARSLLEGQLTCTANLYDQSPRVARSAALRELRRLSDPLLWTESRAFDPEESLDRLIFSVLESLRLVSTSSSEVALAASRYPELAGLRSRVAEARAELNDLSTSAPDDRAALESWRKALVDLADDRDGLERELRSALAAKGVFTETITSEGVARALAEGSLAVGFFRYAKCFDKDPDTGETPPAVDSLLAFVVTRDGAVRRVELGAISELEELATRWRALLGKPVERGVGVANRDEEELTEETAGRALRERLLDPCLAVLGDEQPQRIHVVLDDFLHLVPVDALPWSDGRRVGEALAVHLEVSMRRLVAPPRPTLGEGTLVAMGAVDFGAEEIEAPGPRITITTPPVREPGARGSAPHSFSPLIQSRFEVEAVGVQYQRSGGVEPVVLLEAQATKKALVELAPRVRYLHIATHGWFAAESFKSMRDRAEEQGSLSTGISRAEETLRGFAAETLCGLALAGANHGRNELGKVPGILTAEELATLDLSNCELAVLSACETNVGLRRAGQGIQSLQGALHAAGVRTAITSLWKVDDAATRRLMELFYTKLWEEGLGKAEALWQAKMALRADGHGLSDWAGWVLTGDPY